MRSWLCMPFYFSSVRCCRFRPHPLCVRPWYVLHWQPVFLHVVPRDELLQQPSHGDCHSLPSRHLVDSWCRELYHLPSWLRLYSQRFSGLCCWPVLKWYHVPYLPCWLSVFHSWYRRRLPFRNLLRRRRYELYHLPSWFRVHHSFFHSRPVPIWFLFIWWSRQLSAVQQHSRWGGRLHHRCR